MRYAGAKTNLYQKIDEEVVEIKGDKKSLGYERKEHPIKFKVTEFDLDQNPSFFIFSDGVTDPVGGEKKLMYGKKRVIAHIKQAVDVHSAVNNIFLTSISTKLTQEEGWFNSLWICCLNLLSQSC